MIRAVLKWMGTLTLVVLTLSGGSVFAQTTKKVLLLSKQSSAYREVAESMRKGLSSKYYFSEVTVDKGTPFQVLQQRVDQARPDLLLLMDNEAVQFALDYNRQKKAKKSVRGVALMGLNFDTILKGNEWISGIAYEPPAFSLITQFRYLVSKPIKNVLTLYRRSTHQEMVEQASRDLSLEGIKLHAKNVEERGNSPEQIEVMLREFLASLPARKNEYDALWVVLDSALLSQSLFSKSWLPAAREAGIPFITSSDSLVTKEMGFATFAITPNLSDLASQALQQVDQILRDQVSPKDLGVEHVISVDKILNLELATKLNLSIRSDRLGDVRRVE